MLATVKNICSYLNERSFHFPDPKKGNAPFIPIAQAKGALRRGLW